MNQLNQKPLLIFFILFGVITTLLVIIPVNVFPGVIVYEQGLQFVELEAPLTLGNFVGLGFQEGDLDQVKTFYLKPQGYALAFIACIGLPGLIAYRFHVKKQLAKKD